MQKIKNKELILALDKYQAGNLSQWINLLYALVDDCYQIIHEMVITIGSMLNQSSTIEQLVPFGLKIKSPLARHA